MAASSSRRSFSSTASLTKELRDFARPAATSFFARRRTSPGMLRATFAEFILFYYLGSPRGSTRRPRRNRDGCPASPQRDGVLHEAGAAGVSPRRARHL